MTKIITVMTPDCRLYSLQNPQSFSTLSGLLQDYGIERKGLVIAVDQDLVSSDCYSEPLPPSVKRIFLMFQRVETLSRVLVECLKAPQGELDVPYDIIDVFSLGNVELAKRDLLSNIVRGHFVPLNSAKRMCFYLYHEDGDTVGGFLNQCQIPSDQVGIRIYQGKRVLWRGERLSQDNPRLTDLMVANTDLILESRQDFVIEEVFNRLLFCKATFTAGVTTRFSSGLRPVALQMVSV